MGLATPQSKITGVEENKFLIQSSIESIQTNSLKNIEFIHLDLDQFLDHYSGPAFDLVYLENRQNRMDSIRQLQKVISHLTPNARIILNDIHGSAEKYQTWKEIKQWPNFNCTLETKQWGMVFCDPTLTPGSYVFCESHWKPWQKYF